MNNKVTIINYNMGNLYSIENAFNFIGCKTLVTDNFDEICNAKNLVLPGVGSFKKAMEKIKLKKIDVAIKKSIFNGSKILGICLGMQLLGKSSTEEELTYGLGLVNNEVLKFRKEEITNFKIPHVGFNSVKYDKKCKLFNNIKQNSDFYFVHSYRMKKLETNANEIYSYFNYGDDFIASFEKQNIFGTQFHPEKSQSNGLKLLKNFLNN